MKKDLSQYNAQLAELDKSIGLPDTTSAPQTVTSVSAVPDLTDGQRTLMAATLAVVNGSFLGDDAERALPTEVVIGRALRHRESGLPEAVGLHIAKVWSAAHGGDAVKAFLEADPDYKKGPPLTTASILKLAGQCGWVKPLSADTEAAELDNHRNTPTPSEACLYGFVGDVARAAHAANREVNLYAAALNMLVLLAAGIGRGVSMPIGDDWHHARLFGLHVGRSGRGRKGTSGKLPTRVQRKMAELHPDVAFQTHNGGLSSREGLVVMIHDGLNEGKTSAIPAVLDKRLAVLESEFVNVLHQAAREGNTLSAALRDAWDGTCIKPATKHSPVSATRPHINLMGHITPSELLDCMKSRELTNGFANRFLMIWAEQGELDPLPGFTPDALVVELADRMASILRYCKADRYADGDHTKMTFTPAARELYVKLYKGEFQDRSGGELVAGMMTRQAPYLVRLAMLFALTDKAAQIDLPHMNAAHAWVRYWRDSVKFIFASAREEAEAESLQATIKQLVEFLQATGEATRMELSKNCFKGHIVKSALDAALDDLLKQTPPVITVEDKPRTNGPGRSAKVYRLNTAAKFANIANVGPNAGQNQTSQAPRSLRTLRILVEPHSTGAPENHSPEPNFANFANFAEPAELAETQVQSQTSQTSQTSHGVSDSVDDSIPADGVF
jgi:hypothetical protein